MSDGVIVELTLSEQDVRRIYYPSVDQAEEEVFAFNEYAEYRGLPQRADIIPIDEERTSNLLDYLNDADSDSCDLEESGWAREAGDWFHHERDLGPMTLAQALQHNAHINPEEDDE